MPPMAAVIAKRVRELAFLDRFRGLWPGCPQGMVCAQEQPDFIFSPNYAPIGVEVTELVRRPGADRRPLQEQESLKKRLGAEATRLYQQRELPPLHVSVHIRPGAPLDKSGVRALAAKLVEIVAAIEIAPDHVVRHPASDDYQTRLPHPVLSLTVGRIAGLTSSHWTVPMAAWIPLLDVEHVQNTIYRKSKTSRQELPVRYSCWLLMVIGGPGLASSFTVPDALHSHVFNSSFEQLFLMERAFGRVWQLSSD